MKKLQMFRGKGSLTKSIHKSGQICSSQEYEYNNEWSETSVQCIRERDRERERETDRQTDRETNRQTE